MGEAGYVRALALLAAGVFMPGALIAQSDTSGADYRLVVNHESRTATLFQEEEEPQHVEPGETLRLKAGQSLELSVASTNSALYDYTDAGVTQEFDPLNSVRRFGSQLRPYFMDLFRLVLPKRPGIRGEMVAPPPDAQTIRNELRRRLGTVAAHLRQLDSLVNSPRGMPGARIHLYAALGAMKLGQPIRVAHARLPRWVSGTSPGAYLRTAAAILDSLSQATAVLRDLYGLHCASDAGEAETHGPEDPCPGDLSATGGQVIQSATAALEDSDAILGAATNLSNLGHQVLDAKPSVMIEEIEIASGRRHEIVLRVRSRIDGVLGRLGGREDLDFSVTVEAVPLVRPALGLALIGAPDAEYPQFATDGESIVRTGKQDFQVQWGLTLGLVWRGLPHPLGFTFHLPEITVNPDDVRAAGIGGAVSWNFLKAGSGILFTRHQKPESMNPAEAIQAGRLLQEDSYSDPSWYWSVSVVGFPPFVPEL